MKHDAPPDAAGIDIDLVESQIAYFRDAVKSYRREANRQRAYNISDGSLQDSLAAILVRRIAALEAQSIAWHIANHPNNHRKES